jgi:hypothetical protein
VPRQILWSAAAAGLCAIIAATSANAQKRQQYSMAPEPTAPIVGTYKSDAFFPSPLVLTITGMDRNGNLSGSISGYRSSPLAAGETLQRWETWQRTFGRDSRAVYRDGKVTITFPNGATYALDNRGSELAGNFTSGTENQPMSFRKSYGIAQR